jgi:hypothetical protein
MATDKNSVTGSPVSGSVSEMQRKRAAARAITSEKVSKLSEDDKYALRVVRQTKSSLDVAQDRLVNGKGCTVEFLQACATINGAAAGLFSTR